MVRIDLIELDLLFSLCDSNLFIDFGDDGFAFGD